MSDLVQALRKRLEYSDAPGKWAIDHQVFELLLGVVEAADTDLVQTKGVKKALAKLREAVK